MTQVETFDLDLQTRQINLRQRDGSVELHEVREMTGIERDRYLKTLTRRRRGSNNANIELENIQADLIARCLFRVQDNLQYKVEQIEKFPATLQKRLYDIAKELSALNTEEENDKSKKRSPNSTDDDNDESETDDESGDPKN